MPRHKRRKTGFLVYLAIAIVLLVAFFGFVFRDQLGAFLSTAPPVVPPVGTGVPDRGVPTVTVHVTTSLAEYGFGDSETYTVESNQAGYVVAISARRLGSGWFDVGTFVLNGEGVYVGSRTSEFPGFWEIRATVDAVSASASFTVKGVLLVVENPVAYYTEPIDCVVYSNYPDVICAIHWESRDIAERPSALSPVSMGPIIGSNDITLDAYGSGTGTLDLHVYWGYFWDVSALPAVVGASWSNVVSVERYMYSEY